MTARRNPIGPAIPSSDTSIRLVRIGKEGEMTHIYDPNLVVYQTGADAREEVVAIGAPLCKSGYKSKAGMTGVRHKPQLYWSNAKHVTCLRCARLAMLNEKKYKRWLPHE